MAGLLLLFAHPDDESFFVAGTIARYSTAGVPVALVCATRGERGSTADLCTIEELPRVREAELRDAAGILGIQTVEMLPYEDQKLWSAPMDEIRRSLVTAIRRHRPEIVITFDPNGGNRHTDHISISQFASDALAAATDFRWYPETGPPHSIRRLLWQAPVPPFELGGTTDVVKQPGVDILIDTAPFRDKKLEALRAHRTQFPGLNEIFSRPGALSLEGFRVAWGARPQSVPASDLFAP